MGEYGGFLLNYTKIPLIVLCWKSVESVLRAGRKKRKFYIYLANEEIGAATIDPG